jgi:hypothetical protein
MLGVILKVLLKAQNTVPCAGNRIRRVTEAPLLQRLGLRHQCVHRQAHIYSTVLTVMPCWINKVNCSPACWY